MISDASLGSLRVAATLVHSLPGLRAGVRVAGDPLLEVGPGRDADRPDPGLGGVRTCSPCQFRAAVGHAHQRTLDGERFSFLGLPRGVEPEIDLAAPTGGLVRAGGIHRVPVAGRWWWAFGCTLHVDQARPLGQELADGWPDLPAGDQLRLRWDPLTQVTVAYVETSAPPGSSGERCVVELLDALLARWTVDELVGPSSPFAARR